MNMAQATEKFSKLTSKFIDVERKNRIVDAVTQLEHIKVRHLMELLNFNPANRVNEHLMDSAAAFPSRFLGLPTNVFSKL